MEGRGLHVAALGDGDRIVFVHGSLGWGEGTWAAQRPLADRFRLLLVDRRGFGDSPGPNAGNWETDADDIAELLPQRAHLVGHSYGGVASLLAAAKRPDAVRSLTVLEPPAFGLVRGESPVEELIRRITAARLEATSPEDYVQRFLGGFGLDPPPAQLQGKELRGAESSWHERSPWEAEIPLEALRRAPFPKLVVRGAWDQVPPDAEAVGKPSFHAVCDVLVDELDAETATIAGVAHSIPRAGERLNRVLREFLEQA